MFNIKLKKGMSREVVNNLINGDFLLMDDVFLGVDYKHKWKCKCGDDMVKMWSSMRKCRDVKCNNCIKNDKDKFYKSKIEENGDYEFIRSFRKHDVLPSGKIVGDNPYIQIKHKYCGNTYEIFAQSIIRFKNECTKCCRKYENSFAYHIEVELGESLEKYWDFEKNTVNPHQIWKGSDTKVWIKCQEKDYHGSYEITCNNFINNRRCGYCHPTGNSPKIHPYDSFGYHNFDKAMSWHPDNDISPFKVACGSDIKKYKFICFECGSIFEKTINSIKQQDSWCPECSMSKGEKKIAEWLRYNGIEYEYEKTYKGLIGLGGGNLSYDFYLPEYNLLIEYQGEQHRRFVAGWHINQEGFEKQLKHDDIKREYAENNNINLLEIWEDCFDNIEKILDEYLGTMCDRCKGDNYGVY